VDSTARARSGSPLHPTPPVLDSGEDLVDFLPGKTVAHSDMSLPGGNEGASRHGDHTGLPEKTNTEIHRIVKFFGYDLRKDVVGPLRFLVGKKIGQEIQAGTDNLPFLYHLLDHPQSRIVALLQSDQRSHLGDRRIGEQLLGDALPNAEGGTKEGSPQARFTEFGISMASGDISLIADMAIPWTRREIFSEAEVLAAFSKHRIFSPASAVLPLIRLKRTIIHNPTSLGAAVPKQ